MRALVVLAITGCGRLQFDPLPDATHDTTVPGDGIAVTWPTFSAPQLSPISTIYDDWTPEISRDGLLLFGAAYGAPGAVGEDDLWMTSRTNEADTFPAWTLIPGLGTAGRDFGPAISIDGLTIMYGSGGSGFSEPPAIFTATRMDLGGIFTGVAQVSALTGGTNTVTRDPGLSADGLTIYFDSDRAGSYDIWYATRATTALPWSPPVALAEVNTTNATERDPFISADGRTLYFASDRSGTQGLWVTIRQNVQLPFEPPQELTALNGPFSQGNPTISDSGLLLWDSTRAGGPGGTFGYDIWQAQLQ